MGWAWNLYVCSQCASTHLRMSYAYTVSNSCIPHIIFVPYMSSYRIALRTLTQNNQIRKALMGNNFIS